MALQKRGAAMISFHWLLVALAGGSLFILFSMFINTGQQAADNSLSIDVLLHFDTIFSSLVTTEKTEATLPSRQEIELEFTCRLTDQTTDSSFRLTGGVTKGLDNIILFSKSSVSGDSIFTIARNYAIPFSVSSLLYVSDPNVIYVIEATTPAKRDKIESLLPKNASIIRLGENNIPFLGSIDVNQYQKVVVIGLTAESQAPQSLSALASTTIKKNVEIYLFHIEGGDDFMDGGKVTGYKPQEVRGGTTFTKDGDSVEYNSDELLGGILFSQNTEWFSCVKQKLLDKISRVSFVLAKRADILANEYTGGNGICKTTYENSADIFTELVTDPASHVDKASTLRSYNERLELQSCPLLY